MKNEIKILLIKEVEALKDTISHISSTIHGNPETSGKEVMAVELLTAIFKDNGFKVTKQLAGFPTAFQAEITSNKEGPRIALLAEYDALPDLGHACGHNLIAAASAGAALALSRVVKRLRGTIVVIGTPAEETNGAKVKLVEAGVFEHINAAMMFHPGDCNTVEVTSSALEALEFIFQGKAAHAASAAEYGINALEGLFEFFQHIKLLREDLPETASVQGIITEGGLTPNIIPERAAARFYLRDSSRQQLNDLVKKVQSAALEAAEATATKVKWYNYEYSYENLVTNIPLAKTFAYNLNRLGVADLTRTMGGKGSLDMGNVSHKVPAIHPYLTLVKSGVVPHSREFAAAAGSEQAEKLVLLASKALAMTSVDLMLNPALLKHINNYFEMGKSKKNWIRSLIT